MGTSTTSLGLQCPYRQTAAELGVLEIDNVCEGSSVQ